MTPIILVAAFFAVLIFIWQKFSVYQTWKRKNVPHVSPVPFFGNFSGFILQKKAMWQTILDLYKQFPNERYFGVYQFFQPILALKDPEVIKDVTIKDFHHFSEHAPFVVENFDMVWSNNLLAMKTKRWKHMRPTLSPAFTSGKMKMMYHFMQQTAEQFTEYFLNQNKDEIHVELKSIFTKYTNDVIASTAFGLECDTMNAQDNQFYLMGKKLTNFRGLGSIRFFMYRFSPLLQKLLNLKIVSDDIKAFFSKVIYDTLKLRREKGLVRKDMLYLLLEAQKGVENKPEISKQDNNFASTTEFINNENNIQKPQITDDDIVSQAMIFFLAGFDTASTLMCTIGYELCINPTIQTKLRKEIDNAYEKCNGTITYDQIMEMKYLDMVVSECLRKYPPIPFFDRLCVKPYVIPSDKGEEPLVIEKNTVLWLPAVGLHRDPKFYPNPDKFDPERFNDENKHKILANTYIPFGNGPRNCIGNRFALLENKVIWINLLRKFEVVPAKDTPLIEPKWDPTDFSFLPKNGYPMLLKKRNE